MTGNNEQQPESDEADANTAVSSDVDDALDTIVDELRVLLAKQHAGALHADELAVSIGAWLAILIDRVQLNIINNQRRGEAEADGDAEDITDVLAMVLTACLQNKWRETMEGERDPIGSVLFRTGNMAMLLEFLLALLLSSDEGNLDLQPDPGLAACETIYALGRLAQREYDISTMLTAWQDSPLTTRRCTLFKWLHALSMHETTTEQQRLAICYVRFVSEALCLMEGKENKIQAHKDHKPILRGLAGRDLEHWREHTWEQNWQLFDSPFFCMSTFGSASDCEAMVKRILQGFSIPQVDATDAAAIFNLGSFLLSADFDELLGLRHKVDVTLVKDGETHPHWQLNDMLRFADIVNAFKSGYTIGIRGVHARSQLIAGVCSALQDELKQHVNANIYWTPPGEQGFNLHVDDHCVFVIQLKGKKNWHLKEHIGILPSLYEDLSEPPKTEATEQLVLVPGKVLYIPRGTPHCADTKGLAEDSVHVTIGVEIEMQFTKRQFVRELLSSQRSQSDAVMVVDLAGLDKVIEAAMESEMLQNELRGGLMSWHLETDLVFQRELTGLLGKLRDAIELSSQEVSKRQDGESNFHESLTLVEETLGMYATSEEKVASLRQKVLDERDAFLSSRQQLADMFTLLHRPLHCGSTTTTAAPECQDKFQANKKTKLEDS